MSYHDVCVKNHVCEKSGRSFSYLEIILKSGELNTILQFEYIYSY